METQPDDRLILLAQEIGQDKNLSISKTINSYYPLISIVGLGFLLSIIGFFSISYWQSNIGNSYTEYRINQITSQIEGKLDDIKRHADMVLALFDASSKITPDEFETFSNYLLSEKDNNYIITWAPIILHQENIETNPEQLLIDKSHKKNEIKAFINSDIALQSLKKIYATKKPEFIIHPLGGKNHIIYLSPTKTNPTKDQKDGIIIIATPPSTLLKIDDVKNINDDDFVIVNNETILASTLGQDSEYATKHLLKSAPTTISDSNLTLLIHRSTDKDIETVIKYFKWITAGLGIAFTFLLSINFVIARKSIQKMAALAVTRTGDLTSLNDQLEEEIFSRIQFQAELLQRNADIQDANDQLKDAKNQLIQQEKLASLGQLAAGVAHEINNPVGFINSNLSMLEKYVKRTLSLFDTVDKIEEENSENNALTDLISEKKKEIKYKNLRRNFIDIINESKEGVTRVKQIVQDLKDFSRVDEAEWQWTDIHECIESTLNIARNEIKYIATVEKDFSTLPQIECVPSQINQVLMNLLVNAAQAMTEPGTITIKTAKDKDMIWITVEDTGSGMPEEVIAKIFDPFFTTKEVGKGTGLGLSLSYGIITKHHGELSVKSTPGKGTKFHITLPIEQIDNEAKAE